MSNRDVVICSFYTPDEYYGGHARELEQQLKKLGIKYELWEIQKAPDEDWADVTRKKIAFIRKVCKKHPTKMVFWIDVDCRISHLPEFISETTADFIGFQRSFGSPLQIGYHNRTRFWEPSFWGVNATKQGRKLIEDAYELEQRAIGLKATDDYFLEEAWRGNAKNLTFQMIPATSIIQSGNLFEPGQRDAFFSFGSSGNVANFKGKVVQHGSKNKQVGLKRKLLKQAKNLEARLPEQIRKPLRQVADTVGITATLTAGQKYGIDQVRSKLIGDILTAGQAGERESYEELTREFQNKYVAAYSETSTIAVAETFLNYADRGTEESIKLAWWTKPFPGNFGDWLSPLMVSNFTSKNLKFQSPEGVATSRHLISLGSIGRFIKPNSVVLGTGISSEDLQLAKSAKYISVRGPITARVLRASGGKNVSAFGDPGLALSRVISAKRGKTNGKIAFVRHFTHAPIPMQLPDSFDELSVLMSSPQEIEGFVKKLIKYDAVVTSAMHVMITCQSYGIPCALVTFEGYEENVHGTGIKYEDYALGAEVPVMNPKVIPLDLRKFKAANYIEDIKVSESKKDEVVEHIKLALTYFEGTR